MAAGAAGVAHHLVSRALDVTQQHFNGGEHDGEKTTYHIGFWAAMALLATFLTYLGIISMVNRP